MPHFPISWFFKIEQAKEGNAVSHILQNNATGSRIQVFRQLS
jgi:hypothetical protein